MSDQPFGSRLRRERERRQIDLTSISASTKISVTHFEALERDDVSRWPTGIFRRAFVRAYAKGIGLDPDQVVREFLERFPEPTEVPASVAPNAPIAFDSESAPTVLRLTLADTGTAFRRGGVLGEMGRRLAAVTSDAAVVLAVAVGAFAVSDQFWLPLSVSALGYYWAGIVLLGNTPGVCLWASASGHSRSRSVVITTRAKIMKAAVAYLVRFKRATSAPDQPGTLRSEARPSRS